MLLSERRAGGAALAVILLIAFSDVALRSARAMARPPEQPNAVSVTDPDHMATFHTFDIEEVFSNDDASVQFIELLEADGAQGNLHFAGKLLTTNANLFTYPTDLPGTATANRFVLIATAGFATLPGAVTPDYIVPPRFFEMLGDTISIRETTTTVPVDVFSFGVTFLLPTDGILSLNRDGTTGVNSPTNFAGDTGSVNAARPVPALSPASLAVMALLLVGAAVVIARMRLRRS